MGELSALLRLTGVEPVSLKANLSALSFRPHKKGRAGRSMSDEVVNMKKLPTQGKLSIAIYTYIITQQ